MINIVNILNANQTTTIPTRNARYIQMAGKVKISNEVINRRNFYNLTRIFSIINNADIIHTHHTFSSIVVSLCFIFSKRIRSRVRFVHTVHRNFLSFSYFDRAVYLFLIYPFRNSLIANSTTTKLSLKNFLSVSKYNDVTVIPNGVDLSKVRDKIINSSDNIRIISIGRMVKIKDQRTVIRAVKYLSDKNYNVNLDFCGDGVLRDELEKMVKAYKITSNVKFHGMISENEIFNILSKSDFSIISSINEGFGVATIESMASKALVLASNIDINFEIIQDNDLLFKIGDYKKLANLIIYYSDNHNLYNLKINQLHRRSRLYESSITGSYHLSFYLKIFRQI